MRKSYYNPKAYYDDGEEWVAFIKSLKTNKKKQYWEGIMQEIRHVIGITNWVNKFTTINGLKYNPDHDVRFINLVFNPNPKFTSDSNKFNEYYKLYIELHKQLVEQRMLPSGIIMDFMTYGDIWSDIRAYAPSDLVSYLEKHYMQFAAV